MLLEIALLTGSKTITKGIDIELKNTQISDLGHAGKVTLDKNNHVSRRQAQVRTAFL
jgi:chaperonin GroEL (HSP60 family)